MATVLLIYCWLKLIYMHLFTMFAVMCLQTSNIERKCLYIGIDSNHIHYKQQDINNI